MAIIKLDNLTKEFTDKKVFDNLSLEILDGEFTVFTGTTMSGKSLLVRLICGLEDITSGSLTINGVISNDLSPKDRDIALVNQSLGLDQKISIFDNMATGLKYRKVNKNVIEERVNKAAELIGLTDKLKLKSKDISVVDRLKAMVGRAIARQPQIIIFDEPFKGVDEKSKNELLELLIKLNKRTKINFIYATQNPSDSMYLADKIAYFEKGELVDYGTPSQIYDSPKTLAEGVYFGDIKMNMLQGTLGEDGVLSAQGYKVGAKNDNLKEYIGKENGITLAFRGEDVKVDDKGVLATIKSKKKIEDKTLYTLSIDGGSDFVALLDGDYADQIKVLFDEEYLLFFDTETEKLL